MSEQDDKGGWYWSADEERYFGPFETREDAIDEGKNDEHGVIYLARGGPKALPDNLWDDLGEFLDDTFEEHTFEDSFCSETRLSKEELQEFRTFINLTWRQWRDRIGLQARVKALDLRGYESVETEHFEEEP